MASTETRKKGKGDFGPLRSRKRRRQGGTAKEIQELNLNGAWAKDPYDGGFLKFQTSEFGPVLYLTGNDRVDDGGGEAILGQQKVL